MEKELLKLARDAFERASTLSETQRIEVYIENNEAKISDPLEESEHIIYTPTKLLSYQIYGYNYLEEEIKTWIDFARNAEQAQGLEESIQELISEMAKKENREKDSISSYEVFANMPVTLLGTIEQQILEYWWNAKEEQNAKSLALAQIQESLAVLQKS